MTSGPTPSGSAPVAPAPPAATQPAPAAPESKWRRLLADPVFHGLLSLAILLLLLGVAGYAWRHHMLATLAISLGAAGGVVHEIAQSRGTIVVPRAIGTGADREVYLGTLSGLILGAAAGVLAVQGTLTSPAPDGVATGPGSAFLYTLAFAAFAAGLGLKGIAEAATTMETKQATSGA